MKILPIEDASAPSATTGAVFTASIGTKEAVKQGNFLDSIYMGLYGAVSTAAVVIETFAGLVSEFVVRSGDKTVIQLAYDECVALSCWFYNKLPRLWENTDNTGADFIFGVRIPIQQEVSDSKRIYYAATRAAQTNIGTEALTMSGKWLANKPDRKGISAVRIPYTTAAATGFSMMGVTLPPIGKLIGIIVKQTAEFADGDNSLSIQRLRVFENGEMTNELNVAADTPVAPFITDGTLSPATDLLKDFHSFDFREEPIDLSQSRVELAVETQDASDAVVIIPIIELA